MFGDIVIPSGQRIAYTVTSVRDVLDIDNVLMKDCAAEVYVPPVNP